MSDNTGSNLGTGQGIFGQKVGDDLQFKSLVGGTGVTLSADANEITINSSATVSSATNLGSGTGLFVDLTTGSLNFKSLAISTGLSIANTGTTVTISVDSANLNAGTLGGLASSVFLQKSDNLAAVTNVATARTNLGVYSKTETDAKYFTNDANSLPVTDNTIALGDNSKRFSDVYAIEFHGTATRSGVVTSIADHDIGSLQNVDETGKSVGHVLKYDGTNWVSTIDGGATNLGALTDVDTSGVANGQVLKFNSTTSKFEAADDSGAGGGSSTFVGLSDTPNNYSGAASKFVKANAGGNGLEFVADPGYITDLSSFSTTNLAEGTNLYYTDARADARIGAASINALSDVDTSGASTNDTLKWNGTNWVPTTPGSGIALTDLSVATGSASGGGTLTYNSGTGAFSFAPADLSSYLTSVPAQTFASLTGKPTTVAGYGITDASSSSATETLTNKTIDTANNTITIVEADISDLQSYLTSVPAQTFASLTGKPTTLAGYGITDGYANSDVDTHLNQSNPTSGYVLSWNGSDYAWVAQSGGIALTDLSTTTAAASGGGTLSYNNGTGAFTFAPADLSSYQTTAGLNGAIDTHLNQSNPTAGYVLSWNGSDYAWVDNGVSGASSFTGLTDTPANYTSGANKFVKVNSAGNALEYVADPGYLTSVPAQSFASLTGKPTTIAGYGITDGYANSDADARIVAAGSANWNTAFGWGDHSTAGYLTSVPAQSFASLTGKPTTIAGYGITDALELGTSATTALAGNTTLFDGVFASLTSKPTTIAGYGITDALELGTSSTTALAGDTTLFDNSAFDTRLATKSTTNLAEGTNLYYTDARADGRIALQVGANLDLSSKDTGDLAEGSNLYYTDARADARITNALIDEDNMASDSATRLPSQQSVKAYVDSQIASENELSEMNDVTIASVQNNDFIKYNASTSKWENASVTAATAAGSDTYVQFNDGGVMGGDSGFTYNKTTDALTVGSISTSGASGTVSSTTDLDITTSANNSNIGIVPHGTGDIELGTNVLIDGSDNGYLKWTAPYSSEASLPSASTYHGMFAHVHGTGKGYFAHGGNWIKLLDETSSSTTNLSEGTNLYYTDARADARITAALIDEDNMASDSATRLPSQQSVKAYVDSQILTKDNTDEIAEGSSNLYFTDARADARIVAAGSANWNTAFGWGDHSTAGYLTSFTETNDLSSAVTWANVPNSNITQGSVTQHQAALSITESQISDLGSYLTSVPAQSFASLTGKPTTLAGYGITDAFDGAYGSLTGAPTMYANSDVDAHLNQSGPTSGYVLSWNGSDYAWVAQSGGSSSMNTAGNTGTGSVAFASQNLVVTGQTGQINVDAAGNYLSLSLASDINSITSIAFEGSTADANETKLQATDPTADRTINLPDATGHLAVFATAPTAAITDGTAGQALVTDGSGALSFTTITSGSSLTVQDEGSALSTAATTINFVGAGVTASGSGATKTITIAGGGGGGGTTYEEFKINYSTSGQVSSISDTSSNITSVNIDSAAGGDLTVNFQNYTTPPLSFAMYGYNYAANKYNYNTVASGSMTLRELPGGGSSGSPTAFGSFSNMQIRCSESETGASRSFGTTTHAWVRFVMGA